MELTSEYLHEIMRYEPDTGSFFWIKPRKGARKNKPAGCVSSSHKYRSICIDKVWHRAHRLAWFYMTGAWPDMDIDHKDRNKSNNAWVNLRLATMPENSVNCGIRSNNKSGFAGVSWDAKRNKWLAQIRINGKKTNLGRYEDKQVAIDAWKEAAQSSFPEFRGLVNVSS